MALTKTELIALLQDEVRILLHLAGKVEPLMLDYRPTPKQRSTLELLQYLSMMGPVIIDAAKERYVRWRGVDGGRAGRVARDLPQTIAAIAALADTYAAGLGAMSDADFAAEVALFGPPASRGAFIVNNVLSGHAAYRTQLFLLPEVVRPHPAEHAEPLGRPGCREGVGVMDPVTRSIDQLVGAWRLLCGRGPRHVLASGDGVEYAFSGLQVPFFNLAAVTAHDVTAETLAAQGREAWRGPPTRARACPGCSSSRTSGWRPASMPWPRWTRVASPR